MSSDVRRWLILAALSILPHLHHPAGAASAPFTPPRSWQDNDIDPRTNLNEAERRAIQAALGWVGAYRGAYDGLWSQAVFMAMRSWRSTSGYALADRLSRAELVALFTEARRAQAEAGWTSAKDPNTGFWFAWPAKSSKPPMPARDEMSYGSDYEPRGADGLKLMTRVTTGEPQRLIDNFIRIIAAGGFGAVGVTSRQNTPDRQTVTLLTGSGASVYIRYDHIGDEWHGFALIGRTTTAPLWLLGPIAAEFTGTGTPLLPATDKQATPTLGDVLTITASATTALTSAAKPSPPPQLTYRPTGSGTAFVVNRNGALLTNAHVVNGCEQLKLADGTEISLLAIDRQRDLALVKAVHVFPSSLAFRRDPIEHGEQVRVFGFPYYRIVSESLNITDGIVTSLTGLRGNSQQFQMSANLQPGNSGGPVLDAAGNVIGVSVAILNSLAVARLTGTMPQGMNYAIRGAEAAAFLSEHNAAITTTSNNHPRDLRDVAKAATPLVFPLICYN